MLDRMPDENRGVSECLASGKAWVTEKQSTHFLMNASIFLCTEHCFVLRFATRGIRPDIFLSLLHWIKDPCIIITPSIK